ncbi:MAG: hypothetical protein FP810_02535 [Desulfocapsa sp.]|nr:hypothetical protein [Desulfocapsa sp.]
MENNMLPKHEILDCTLRDGGYYTNWDFTQDLVCRYFAAVNSIPEITYVEIGYRSLPMKEYLGEYFYCPAHVMQLAREKCPDKKIAIMLNEKSTRLEDLNTLLYPCEGYIDMIRLAVDPVNIERASRLAREIISRGFEVGLNVMYMSKWIVDDAFLAKLRDVDTNYLTLVDSYGSVYPQEVKDAFNKVKSTTNIPLGFHGHNNLELALANSLAALDNGCNIVDVTITGMGRGAGNLKTELLLTCLDSKENNSFNYNGLTSIISEFEKLQKVYEWGTSLPYMISGAFSLPQKDVMSWISKKRYTPKSIINALQNHKDQQPDNQNVPILNLESIADTVVIVGGGANSKRHAHALKIFCKKNPSTVLIHAGSRHISDFSDLGNNKQFVCLLGSEGYKMKDSLQSQKIANHIFIIEPSPRLMGTIIPIEIENQTYELKEITLFNDYPDSLLTIAFQLAALMAAKTVYLFGLDGYDTGTGNHMLEVEQENQFLLDAFQKTEKILTSLTPTRYQNVHEISIYSLI